MPNAAIHVHTLGAGSDAVIVSVGVVVFDEKQSLRAGWTLVNEAQSRLTA